MCTNANVHVTRPAAPEEETGGTRVTAYCPVVTVAGGFNGCTRQHNKMAYGSQAHLLRSMRPEKEEVRALLLCMLGPEVYVS